MNTFHAVHVENYVQSYVYVQLVVYRCCVKKTLLFITELFSQKGPWSAISLKETLQQSVDSLFCAMRMTFRIRIFDLLVFFNNLKQLRPSFGV